MQLRVAIQKEPLDTDKVKTAWSTFKTALIPLIKSNPIQTQISIKLLNSMKN